MHSEKILDLLIKFEKGDVTREELEELQSWYDGLHAEPWSDREDAEQIDSLARANWLAVRHRTGLGPRLPAGRLFSFGKNGLRAAVILIFALAGWAAVMLTGSRSPSPYARAVAPEGRPMQIRLADGSGVILQGGSVLRYPVLMKKTRTLYLDEGQAFFDVTANCDVPFIVKTRSGMQTRVLGTSFSIQTFAELSIERVAVFSGKVGVKDERHDYGTIVRGQAAEFEISRGTGRRWISDSLEAGGWAKGQIVLNDVSFEEFAIAFRHQYGYRIIIQCPDLRRQRISISFTEKDSLAQVLQIIKVIYKVNSKINNTDKYVTIDKSGCDAAHNQ